MGKYDKILQKIIHGRSDANILFSDLRQLLLSLGFQERIRGDHHIFTKVDIAEILNIQPILRRIHFNGRRIHDAANELLAQGIRFQDLDL